MYLERGAMYALGDLGRWWSSNARSLMTVYSLAINATSAVADLNTNNRYHAFPLRCLYLGSV